MTSRDPQQIVEILARVGAELTDLADSVNQLHTLAEGMGQMRGPEREAMMREAQSIDLIEQRLTSLAHFFTELVPLIPADWEITGRVAAQKLKLSALAHRLSAVDATPGHSHVTGEFECF
jgi:hypothetical protein